VLKLKALFRRPTLRDLTNIQVKIDELLINDQVFDSKELTHGLVPKLQPVTYVLAICCPKQIANYQVSFLNPEP
jgi:hypothetical protein